MARKGMPPRRGRTFDQYGNMVNNRRRRSGLNAATQVSDDWSFGASIWEFMHPGTVQREDAAIGAKERSYTEIWDDAFIGMTSAAEETRQEIVQKAQTLAFTLGPIIVIGLVAAAVLAVVSERK